MASIVDQQIQSVTTPMKEFQISRPISPERYVAMGQVSWGHNAAPAFCTKRA